jgi:hypothetical protein
MTKLHCNHCGKTRTMKIGFLIEKPKDLPSDPEATPVKEGEVEMVFVGVRVKALLKNINNKQIPKAYLGQCYTCRNTTFYELRENKHSGKTERSLVVVG